jgi:hypothetical protein
LWYLRLIVHPLKIKPMIMKKESLRSCFLCMHNFTNATLDQWYYFLR